MQLAVIPPLRRALRRERKPDPLRDRLAAAVESSVLELLDPDRLEAMAHAPPAATAHPSRGAGRLRPGALGPGPPRETRHGQNDLGLALGRKNWLFAGSDKGGVRAAIAFTILGSCRMHGKDPTAYLTDVLRKLGDGWPQARTDELLPDRWQAEPASA